MNCTSFLCSADAAGASNGALPVKELTVVCASGVPILSPSVIVPLGRHSLPSGVGLLRCAAVAGPVQ